MKAYFSTNRKVIEQAIKSEENKSNMGMRVFILEDRFGEVVVEGDAQPVMFLIGEVAAYGEDGLIKVEA